jgi:hypothetical protein
MRLHKAILVLAAIAVVAVPATAQADTSSADLATTMSQPGMRVLFPYGAVYEVQPGGTAFTTTITNNGPHASSNVQLVDHWWGSFGTLRYVQVVSGPAGASCTPTVGASNSVTCTASSLAARQSLTIVVGIKTMSLGGRTTLTNSATASSSTPDPNTANNTAQAWVMVM